MNLNCTKEELYWTAQKWWQRSNQRAWWYWTDLWAQVRATHSGRYYFERPSELHKLALTEWNPIDQDYFTQDKEILKNTMEKMGLPIPDWKDNHCFKVYWFDLSYAL